MAKQRKNTRLQQVKTEQAAPTTIENVVPVDKHLLGEASIHPYTPDYIEPWESWNPMRWGKWDYSDYPTQELANNPALQKLGVNKDYVYKKQIVSTHPEEEKKEEYPGTSTNYNEAYNKYLNYIKLNEGDKKDAKTGLFMPYPSPEDDGTYTIGYGHKLKKGQEKKAMFKNGLTQEQVENYFKTDFQNHYKHAKKFIGEDYFNTLPYDQQMLLTDYSFNTIKGLPGFPNFVGAIKAYNAATTDEERDKQRQIIASEYSRKFNKNTPLYQRNASTLDTYLIPSFKIKKAMTDPEKYIHENIAEPNWIYGAIQPIDDNRGQWEHPGEVTRIASNDITMQGVPYPVLGVGADGEQRMMYPEEEHTFNQGPVTEYPMMQAKDGGWLSQYNRGGTTWLNEYAQGGKTFSAGGEKHRVYEKESPTGNGKGVQGHIMVTHPTTDKGQWDTIDLTEKAGAHTVAEGVAATKKWHAEHPNYQNGGFNPLLSAEHQFLQSIYTKPTNERNQYLQEAANQLQAVSIQPTTYTPRYAKSQNFSMPIHQEVESDDSFLDNLIFKNRRTEEKPKEEVKEVIVEPTNTSTISTDKAQANKVSDKLMSAFQKSADEYKQKYPNRPTPVISSGFRSHEKQAELYANRANNPYPVAKPGTSRHELGLAIDVGFNGAHTDQDYANFAAIMNKNGVNWLGAKDKVHFELNQAAYGGELTQYGTAGKVYVSSTTDPRYTRYKDSLDLYNYYKLQTDLENPSGGIQPGRGDGSIGNTLAETGNTLYNMFDAYIPLTDAQKKIDNTLFQTAANIIKNNPNLTWGTDFPAVGEDSYEAYKNAPIHSPDIKTKNGSIKATGTWMGYARNNDYSNVKPHTEVVVAPPVKLNQGDTYVTKYGEYEIVSDPNSGTGVKLKNKKTGQVSEVNRNDIASHIYNKDANITTPKPVQKTTPPPPVKTTTTVTPPVQTQTVTPPPAPNTTTAPQKTTTTTKKTAAPFDPKRGGFYSQDGKYWRYDINGNIVPADRNTNNGMKYGGWLNKYK